MSDAPSDAAAKPDHDPILIDLALQGGGAHGAFTWGVLDRLLEEPEPQLRIEGISGTSAGAMNAAVLAHGHAASGYQGAKAALEDFWQRVSRAAMFSPFRRTPLDIMMGRWTLDNSPIFVALDLAARVFSPYDLNPRGANPMRDILAESRRLCPPRAITDPSVRHRHQRPYRPRPRVSQRRDHPGGAARLGLPADNVSGHRD